MSREYKIALIRRSRSSLTLYRRVDELTDRELDEQVMALVRRSNETAVIARMELRAPTFCLN
jgi:hypothetical protein